jgi:predicted Abi (CAAX) family protease
VLLLALFLLVAVPVGMASGMLVYAPFNESAASFAAFAVVAFVVPSLFEETLYRALILPHPSEQCSGRGVMGAALASVALFVLGHPLIAWLFVPSARALFYDPVFLGLSAAFGVECTLAYLRTGSIWPSVLMHWAVVVGWKIWFGGWIMLLGSPR